MRRHLPFAIIGFVAILLVSTTIVYAEEGKGRTWVCDFGTESAKKDGKIIFKVTGKKGWFSKTYELELEVKKDWTSGKKAEELEKLLKQEFGDDLIVSRAGAVVSVQLKQNAKADDITNVSIKEITTGEKGVHVYDDASETYLEYVLFDIQGMSSDPTGEAILKIGWAYPLVTVSTYGKLPATIKSDLVYWFNYHYHETGYVAEINLAGNVEIKDVPCEEGIFGGVDDSGLSWTLSMGGPPSVGGIVIPVDELGLLAPYIGLTSTVIASAVVAAIYVKRVKHRKEKQ